MILLKASHIQSLRTGSVTALQQSLQLAIELEHATIPPYLFALYSLGTGPGNATVAKIIQSVVSEEMLHMTLACNVLNAVGGHPLIDDPNFIPKYPGKLPGSVDSGLTVDLAPFSLAVIKETFMKIEEPEDPANFPHPQPAALMAEATSTITIGQFYEAIICKLRELGPKIFTGNPALQVTPPFPEGGIVANLDTAITALKLIIDQGEGSSPKSPVVDPPGTELAHYYRFAEIVEGQVLIPDPTVPQGYSYSGQKIQATSPVAAIKPNPKAANYAAGTAERHAMDSFNYTYTSVLKGLHQLFNGQPNTFGRTLGAMMSLRQQALDMMAGVNLHGPIGPSFEYQPVNPAE